MKPFDITYEMALEVSSHEALIRKAYKDSVGVWTWSVGLTNKSGHNVERYIDNPQTLKRCLEVYVWALKNYAEDVAAEFDGHELTLEQKTAALSFNWNTGAIRSASWPDLWKAGRIDEARESFLSWRKPPEILDRRKKEAALFFDGVWSNQGTMGEYTRLRSNYRPDWKSRIEIDVSDVLGDMLKPQVPQVPEEPTSPQPVDQPAQEQLSYTEVWEQLSDAQRLTLGCTWLTTIHDTLAKEAGA